jgi:methionine aminotransferase
MKPEAELPASQVAIYANATEADFSIWLTKQHGVTVIPVSAFYEDPMASTSNHRIVRFCFAKKDTTLDQAIERLTKI